MSRAFLVIAIVLIAALAVGALHSWLGLLVLLLALAVLLG